MTRRCGRWPRTSRRVPLVLVDNCEHLIDACAELVDELLACGPSLASWPPAVSRYASTASRSSPCLRSPSTPTAWRSSVDRARSACGRDVTDVVAATEICRRLDGIPLAIELAAAQTRHLQPAEILDRLTDRFTLLTGGHRRVERHQTLQAAIDWSHDLLTDAERVMLRRLAVFRGSFTAAAATAVCAVTSAEATLPRWSTVRSSLPKRAAPPPVTGSSRRSAHSPTSD